MAGYVFGVLAAGRDGLRYETHPRGASVVVRTDVRVEMARGDDGAYRIVLAQSVPEATRRGLLQVEENADRRRDP